MLDVRSLYVTAAAGALALVLIPAGPSAQQQQPPPPVAPILQNYKPVTPERLKKPEDGDWLMVRRTYDGWGYSPERESNAIANAHTPHYDEICRRFPRTLLTASGSRVGLKNGMPGGPELL